MNRTRIRPHEGAGRSSGGFLSFTDPRVGAPGPLALSLLCGDGSWESFLLPAVAMALAGGVRLWVTASPTRTPGYVSNRDVYLSVTLAWTLAALLGGVPFLIR